MRFITKSCYFRGVGTPRIEPKNNKQIRYEKLLQDKNKPIVVATGPSGTGKTIMACEHAVRALEENKVKKIIITRPAVCVEEQHGFLPGSLDEKMGPWVQPVFDVFQDRWGVEEFMNLRLRNKIEICPLAYMRGRTFKDSWIIADEMQNATPNQMKMILTRIGHKSKIVVTGDPGQHDRGYEVNGLSDFIHRLNEEDNNFIGLVKFTKEDVERHKVIEQILRLYGE